MQHLTGAAVLAKASISRADRQRLQKSFTQDPSSG